VFIRGQASLSIADLHIKDFVKGDPINMLALSTESFTPSYRIECGRATELWAIQQEDFGACMDTFSGQEFQQLQTKLNDLLRGTEFLEIVLKSRARRGAGGDDENWGDGRMSPDSVASSAGGALDLKDIHMFSRCTPEFLQWIAEHLQAAIYFTNDMVVPQGGEDSSLYIIRHGSIISEGTDTAQDRLDAGTTVGEHRLLGIAQKSPTTNQAIEVTVVQILHRSVFLKALQVFPDQVPHFDRLILGQMPGVASFELHRTPLFEHCNPDFCKAVERITRTRLLHPDALLLEEGSEMKVIRIIKCGMAIVDEQHDHLDHFKKGALHGLNLRGITQKAREIVRVTDGATLNADVVLGAARCVSATVRAERLCAVGEIEGPAFLGILQRFPQEIVPLIRTVVGAPWPTDSESVPLFRGVNHHFFKQLMEKSDWIMCLPDNTVVKQGGRGDLLFLLCYGIAVVEVDGIVIGSQLTRGDCIGKPNFFGLTTKYSSSVRTRHVCHFRSVSGAVFAQLLQKEVAERERFELLKVRVAAEAVEQEQIVIQQATREKLRRREEVAFRGHIARERETRGLDPAFSSIEYMSEGKPSSPKNQSGDGFYGMPWEEVHKRNSLHGRKSLGPHGAHPGPRRGSHKHVDGGKHGAHAGHKSHHLRRHTKHHAHQGHSLVERMRQMNSSPVPKKHKIKNPHSDFVHDDDSDSGLTDSDDDIKNNHDFPDGSDRDSGGLSDEDSDSSSSSSEDSATRTKNERISNAISEHIGARKQAIVKGRLMRMMRNGTAGGLSQEDLAELNHYLPKLPVSARSPPASAPASARFSCEAATSDVSNSRHGSTIDDPALAPSASNSTSGFDNWLELRRPASHRIQERNAQLSAGHRPTLPPGAEEALMRKHRQLERDSSKKGYDTMR